MNDLYLIANNQIIVKALNGITFNVVQHSIIQGVTQQDIANVHYRYI